MSNLYNQAHFTPPITFPDFAARESNWYAIHIRARHEKRVASLMQEKQIS